MKGKPFQSWVLRVLEPRMLRRQERRWQELANRSKSCKHPEPFCWAEGIPAPSPAHLCHLPFLAQQLGSEEGPPWLAGTSSTKVRQETGRRAVLPRNRWEGAREVE